MSDSDVRSWELPVIGEQRKVSMTITQSPSKRLLAEVEAIKEAAYQEAYKKGMQQAQAEIEKKTNELNKSIALFLKPLEEIDESIYQQIYQIIIALTQTILQKEISSKPENLVDIIKQIVSTAPIGTHAYKLYLNPDDLKLLKMVSGERFEETSLNEDAALMSGEVRLVNQYTEIDGRVSARLLSISEQIMWQ